MKRIIVAPILVCMSVMEASAQDQGVSVAGRLPLLDGVLNVLMYGCLGIFLAMVAFKVIDLVTPGKLAEEITVKQNVAMAVFSGLFVLGVCVIIAAVVGS